LGISQEKNKLKKIEQGIPKISTPFIPPYPPLPKMFLMGITKKSKKKNANVLCNVTPLRYGK
jgi:hypothetical protein